MKKLSSVAPFIFALFIVLSTNTRGINGARVCLVPLAVSNPSVPRNCNTQCINKFGEKPPGSIKGEILAGNCLAATGKCYCSFCCDKGCTSVDPEFFN
ncbi:hypothetical protein A4A49_02075 [Nicotiana attenuata]|uniref:Defensin-like protein n=1 Tax=Nicotiana attenuata TaxID=49451 RepID=A0A1J6J772_NICAT|nr:hypothetical protein A4A49_02075 [Nicotiana attenuata]